MILQAEGCVNELSLVGAGPSGGADSGAAFPFAEGRAFGACTYLRTPSGSCL